MISTTVVPLSLLSVVLGSSVWVGLALLGTGIFCVEVLRSMPVDKLLAQAIWNELSSPKLLALPLLIRGNHKHDWPDHNR